MALDPLSSAMYFSSVAAASKQVQKEQEKSKTQNTKKTSFEKTLEQEKEKNSLVSAGLPVEIAGMELVEAMEFLKKQIDEAALELDANPTAEGFKNFRKTVSQLLKYVEKNNYEVVQYRRVKRQVKICKPPYFEEVRERDPFFQIHTINENLNQMALMFLNDHADKLKIMTKAEEIKGMIVDFFAV